MASPYERSFLAERRESNGFAPWWSFEGVSLLSASVLKLGQSQWARIGVVKRKHVLQTRRDCRENALARGIRIEDWKAQAVSLQVRQQRAKEAVIVRSPSGAGGSALGVSAWVCMSRRGILGGRQHFDVAAKHVSQNADCRLAQILVVEDGAGARKLRRPKALDSRVPDW